MHPRSQVCGASDPCVILGLCDRQSFTQLCYFLWLNSHVRDTLEKQVFMYGIYVKSGSSDKVKGRYWLKFHDVTRRRTVHRNVNKLRKTGSPLNKNQT
jgi:hypothetical protein